MSAPATKPRRVRYYATGVHAQGEVTLVHSSPYTFSLARNPVGVALFLTREGCEREARDTAARCASLGEPVTDVQVFAR